MSNPLNWAICLFVQLAKKLLKFEFFWSAKFDQLGTIKSVNKNVALMFKANCEWKQVMVRCEVSKRDISNVDMPKKLFVVIIGDKKN